MYKCDKCDEDDSHSKYSFPIITNSENQNNMYHLECCTKDRLLDALRQVASAEIQFYQEVLNLVEDPSQEKLKEFSKNYGTHDEHRSGIQIDKFLKVLAIVDQLKE